MRILLADDQVKVRAALQLFLEQEPDLVVAGEAGNAGTLIPLVEAQQPDVILLDWELPGVPMAVLLPTLRRLLPTVKVIAMSVHPEARLSACEAGVERFVSKNGTVEELLAALQALRPGPLPSE